MVRKELGLRLVFKVSVSRDSSKCVLCASCPAATFKNGIKRDAASKGVGGAAAPQGVKAETKMRRANAVH